MRHTLRQKFAHIGRTVMAWLVAYTVFALVRIYGIGDVEFVQLTRIPAFEVVAGQLILAALVTGVLYGTIDLMMDRPQVQRWSYGRILALKTLLNIVVVVIVVAALASQRVQWGLIDSNDAADTWRDMLASKSFVVFLIYFGIIDFLLNVYQQINQKFGRGVLLEMMMGKYHKPKEDQRIFMFVDLKSSVTIAERLGHVKYSLMMQDCYFDLNTQLSRYKARVYQYVGDEAVIYWTLKDGLTANNCIHFFFGFLGRLEKRSEYYKFRYGFQPFFKAGAHAGKVTVAEIGLLKRDIAFHGDTVNTTSRIQGQCNAFKQRLVISEDLLNLLDDDPKIHTEFIGNEILKGKHREMKLYGVSPQSAAPKSERPARRPATAT